MAEVKKIGVAVIACGARSRGVVHNLLRDSNRGIEILAAYDPIDSIVDEAERVWKVDKEKFHRCSSYMEAINTPGVEWVMVFSPNAYHKEHILAAFNAGKHVFTEKPLATTINDCQEIFDAHQKSGKLFATGFVLRYAPLYRRVKDILDSGVLGDLLAITADENITIQHGSYIMRNWRRHTSEAGPHILEKCCHDLDLINWFCQSVPTRVAAFGSREFFVPKYKKLLKKFGRAVIETWQDAHATKEDAFTSDKDLLDTQVCCADYRNGIKVNFMATMANAIPERRMYFSCSEGTMIAELYSKCVRYRRLEDPEEHVFNFDRDAGLHGGGDAVIMTELAEVMLNGGEPKCSGLEGLESGVFAMALDEAMRKNKVIELEKVWKSLGR